MPQGPICQTEYQEDSQSKCVTCGWDLVIIAHLGQIPKSFESREINHLQWAKNRWSQLRLQQLKQEENKQQIEQITRTRNELESLYSETQEQLSSTQFQVSTTQQQNKALQSQLQQLKTSNNELANQNAQVQSQLTTANNNSTHYQSQIRSRGIQRIILFIILGLMGTSSGIIGYFGYKEITRLEQKNSSLASELQSSRQDLESKNKRIDELESSKDNLSRRLSNLRSQHRDLEKSKQGIENDLSKVKDYYQRYLNKHKIIYQGHSLTWNGELSSSNKTMWTNRIILDKGSYLDISLSNLTKDADFEIVNSSGNSVTNSRQTKVGEDSLSNFYLSKGSYQIKVWLVGSDSTTYRLNVYRRNK